MVDIKDVKYNEKHDKSISANHLCIQHACSDNAHFVAIVYAL